MCKFISISYISINFFINNTLGTKNTILNFINGVSYYEYFSKNCDGDNISGFSISRLSKSLSPVSDLLPPLNIVRSGGFPLK